jgi:hypothetical protein
MGAVAVSLAALAGVDVCGRYVVRRTDAARRHVPITRVALWITHVALWLASALSVVLLIWLIWWAHT